MIDTLKHCRRCQDEKPASEFEPKRNVCKECRAAQRRGGGAIVEKVSNAPFRERLRMMEDLYDLERRTWIIGQDNYAPEDLSPAALIAMRMGWMPMKHGKPTPDSTRVKRVVGLKAQSPCRKRGKVYRGAVRESIPYDLAVRLCRAMDADPVDMGV